MKIMLIVLIFSICQSLLAQGASPGSDSMKLMMDQLKQLQNQQPEAQSGARPQAQPEAREEKNGDDDEGASDWQSSTQASKGAPGLSQQRKMELSQSACRGQAHGVPCSFSGGNGVRISGICYKGIKPNGLFCKPSNYSKPPSPAPTASATPAQAVPFGQPPPGK